HTRSKRDWSSDVCSSDLPTGGTDRGAARDASGSFFRLACREAESCRHSPFSGERGGRNCEWGCSRNSPLFSGRVECPEESTHLRSEERRVGKECRSGWET